MKVKLFCTLLLCFIFLNSKNAFSEIQNTYVDEAWFNNPWEIAFGVDYRINSYLSYYTDARIGFLAYRGSTFNFGDVISAGIVTGPRFWIYKGLYFMSPLQLAYYNVPFHDITNDLYESANLFGVSLGAYFGYQLNLTKKEELNSHENTFFMAIDLYLGYTLTYFTGQGFNSNGLQNYFTLGIQFKIGYNMFAKGNYTTSFSRKKQNLDDDNTKMIKNSDDSKPVTEQASKENLENQDESIENDDINLQTEKEITNTSLSNNEINSINDPSDTPGLKKENSNVELLENKEKNETTSDTVINEKASDIGDTTKENSPSSDSTDILDLPAENKIDFLK